MEVRYPWMLEKKWDRKVTPCEQDPNTEFNTVESEFPKCYGDVLCTFIVETWVIAECHDILSELAKSKDLAFSYLWEFTFLHWVCMYLLLDQFGPEEASVFGEGSDESSLWTLLVCEAWDNKYSFLLRQVTWEISCKMPGEAQLHITWMERSLGTP